MKLAVETPDEILITAMWFRDLWKGEANATWDITVKFRLGHEWEAYCTGHAREHDPQLAVDKAVAQLYAHVEAVRNNREAMALRRATPAPDLDLDFSINLDGISL